MTGGVAVLLGPVGDNFAAGMSGGMAYVWDPKDQLEGRINADMVIFQRLEVPYYIAQLRTLVTEHHAATQSPLAERILREFDREQANFWQIVPKEMLDRLEVPVRAEQEALGRRLRPGRGREPVPSRTHPSAFIVWVRAPAFLPHRSEPSPACSGRGQGGGISISVHSGASHRSFARRRDGSADTDRLSCSP